MDNKEYFRKIYAAIVERGLVPGKELKLERGDSEIVPYSARENAPFTEARQFYTGSNNLIRARVFREAFKRQEVEGDINDCFALNLEHDAEIVLLRRPFVQPREPLSVVTHIMYGPTGTSAEGIYIGKDFVAGDREPQDRWQETRYSQIEQMRPQEAINEVVSRVTKMIHLSKNRHFDRKHLKTE